MESVDRALSQAVGRLSDQNYSQSLAFYRFWFDIGLKHRQIPSDQTFDTIWNNRVAGSAAFEDGKLIHPAAHLILRFAREAESDHILAPHSPGLQSRLSARSLRGFFNNNLTVVWYKESNYVGDPEREFYTDANLIAHWANLGYVEETVIRNDILQSLISHPKLWDHQADALIVLFKLAGATFEAYADPSVVDRCFKLLKDHYNRDSVARGLRHPEASDGAKRGLVQVRAACVMTGER